MDRAERQIAEIQALKTEVAHALNRLESKGMPASKMEEAIDDIWQAVSEIVNRYEREILSRA